ncbi:DUF6445 family protein [Alteromonas sp. C1M14]|uniref:DUF6445 family protein n=1 Tax=Alteromonas sp. C1M14 TaxID=2841567 RepID=UPI001C0A20E0|nr:DUF6445 family protein [Alteromonas sp. C1M14]MBU2979565.1 hypothetical protein [Alteromonas sp. C1M14]
MHTISIGEHKALCIDNFLDQPTQLIDYARHSQYDPYPGYQSKKGYPGVRAPAPQNYSYNLTTYIEPILKRVFNVGAGKDIRKSLCAMSLLTMAEDSLSPIQSTPHFDSSEPNHLAAILYLSGAEHGGTAFYRHCSTGIERITKQNVDGYLDRYYEELNTTALPTPTYRFDSNSQYTKIGYIEGVYNRLVVYPGGLIHNPYIKNSELSISTSPQNGRLTVNTFFDF